MHTEMQFPSAHLSTEGSVTVGRPGTFIECSACGWDTPADRAPGRCPKCHGENTLRRVEPSRYFLRAAAAMMRRRARRMARAAARQPILTLTAHF